MALHLTRLRTLDSVEEGVPYTTVNSLHREGRASISRFRLLDMLVQTHVYLGITAICFAWMSLIVLELPVRWEPLFIAFAQTFFVYGCNRFTDLDEDGINAPERLHYQSWYRHIFVVLGPLIYGLALVIAWRQSLLAVAFALLPCLLGAGYSVMRLKRVFLLKNVIVAGGWGSIALLASAYSTSIDSRTLLLFLLIFLRVFAGAILCDVKDMVGDHVAGVATIPARYGLRGTQRCIIGLNLFYIAFVLMATIGGLLPPLVYPLSLMAVYSVLCAALMEKANPTFVSQVLVDAECIPLVVLTGVGMALGESLP